MMIVLKTNYLERAKNMQQKKWLLYHPGEKGGVLLIPGR